jgi:hypothetical protein
VEDEELGVAGDHHAAEAAGAGVGDRLGAGPAGELLPEDRLADPGPERRRRLLVGFAPVGPPRTLLPAPRTLRMPAMQFPKRILMMYARLSGANGGKRKQRASSCLTRAVRNVESVGDA